jgi:hypothetical protein
MVVARQAHAELGLDPFTYLRRSILVQVLNWHALLTYARLNDFELLALACWELIEPTKRMATSASLVGAVRWINKTRKS